MITTVCQRWRDRRGTYRPAREPINTADFEVAPISQEAPAKAFVLQHHYAASYPAARFRFGLYRRGGALVGVAVFSHPASNAVLKPLPGSGLERCELGRLVLLDEIGGNAESWFLARAFDALRAEGVIGVISFSDPIPRTTIDGRVVFKGHIGNVYQASNAVYTGRGRDATQRLLPDGSVLHGRALSKLRKRDRGAPERGWRYAADRLEAAGAEPLRADEDAEAWVDRWLTRITRKVRHPGNHRYLFALDRAAKRALPKTIEAAGQRVLAFPKFELSEAA